MSKIFKTLYAKSSTGKTKVWNIEAKDSTMVISSGYIDGKNHEQTKEIFGKNIGRSNETTNSEQCVLECQSKWQKKVDEQYTTDMHKLKSYAEQDILLPMLALKFKERKHDISYPAYIQPKLNGVRCIFQNGKFISRGGKEYTTLDHLRGELKKLNIINPDGEIYIHGETMQEIVRRVKKFRPGLTNKLEYWIYDNAQIHKAFVDRFQALENVFKKYNFKYLKLVSTKILKQEKDIKIIHDQAVQNGFEGVIIRNIYGDYKVKHRSANLQKYKEFKDDEFVIIGGKPARGSEAGAIVFEVQTKNKQPFWVRPKGTIIQRIEWMKDLKHIIGKKLTVRYLELSEDGIPTGNTVGIVIRDYE